MTELIDRKGTFDIHTGTVKVRLYTALVRNGIDVAVISQSGTTKGAKGELSAIIVE